MPDITFHTLPLPSNSEDRRAAWIPRDAATPTVAIKLCPQAWPISGKASYSHRTATFGLSAPLLWTSLGRARNAVSSLKLLSTLKPRSSRNSVILLCAYFSSKHSSGWSQMSRLRVFRSEICESIASQAICFNLASRSAILLEIVVRCAVCRVE